MEQNVPPPKPPKPPSKPPKPASYQSNNVNTSSSPPPTSPSSPAIISPAISTTSPATDIPSEGHEKSGDGGGNSFPSSPPSQEFHTIKNPQISSKKKSLQSTISHFTGKLGLSDDIEYQSKSYARSIEEANQRLKDINLAMDGLEIKSEDDPDNLITLTIGNNLLREGYLYKTNRDGMEKYYFILTSEYLTYCSERILLSSSTTRLIHKRSIPLITILLRNASNDFKTNKSTSLEELNELKNKTFLILSKEKSFHLTASSIIDRNDWFHDLEEAIRICHANNNITLTEESMSPVWNPDYMTTSCELCSAEFTLFFRRHHCRNCGKCLCENCCYEKARIPRIDSRKLLLVCTVCSSLLKSTRQYGIPGYVPQK